MGPEVAAPPEPRVIRAAGAVLAAGASVRLGRPKQLVRFGDEPLVRVVARELLGSVCRDVAVVVGAHAAAVGEALEGLALHVLQNEAWQEGMASSVRCAAAWADSEGHDVLVLVTCDQPFLSAAHVDRLVTACARTRAPVGSRYGGATGVPAAFDRSSLQALRALSGDRGARCLLRDGPVTAIDWPDGAFDVDTPSDVQRIDARGRSGTAGPRGGRSVASAGESEGEDEARERRPPGERQAATVHRPEAPVAQGHEVEGRDQAQDAEPDARLERRQHDDEVGQGQE
ncbi:MAG: NTP transferase domain-containing protein [Myxococcales bacterium]|nr:NTP transferase domain-containing protein [Myxococcales bacterium]